MSQVNDALKRVRDTQGTARPDAPILLHATSDAQPGPARWAGLIPPIIFAVVALLGLVGLVLLWQLHQKHTGPIARPTPATTQMASAAKPKSASPARAASKAGAGAATTTAPAPAAPAPAPTIKLQGILYAGRNSTAMISGQSVVVGDEVGGYHIIAIGQSSVTVVNGTQTNVLSLNQ